MKKHLFGIILVITLILITTPAKAADAVYYRYELSSDQPVETISCWFGERGVLIELEGTEELNDIRYLLYNSETGAAYLLKNDKTGQKTTRTEIERTIEEITAQYEEMERKLDNLPAAQREMVRQQMSGVTGEDPREVRDEIEVEFSGYEETTWEGLPARIGSWSPAGTGLPEENYEAIVLNNPPVTVSDTDLAAVREVRNLVEDVTVMLRSLGPMVAEQIPGAPSGNQVVQNWFLSSKHQLQLVEVLKDGDTKFELVDWNRSSPPLPNFTPPGEYEIETVTGFN